VSTRFAAPHSRHIQTLSLADIYNRERGELPDELRCPPQFANRFGVSTIRGIPFDLGAARAKNVLLLDGSSDSVTLPVSDPHPTYVVFLHVVEDRRHVQSENFELFEGDGNAHGDECSRYTLEYADGTTVDHPIIRRFAIQQGRITWGPSAFAAAPAWDDRVLPTANDQVALKRAAVDPGRYETRVSSGRDNWQDDLCEQLWLFALRNPHPAKVLSRLICRKAEERTAIYGISTARLEHHPLRTFRRNKLLLRLPPEATFHPRAALDHLALDLGTVISARSRLEYPDDQWEKSSPDVQPDLLERELVVEYAAHPEAVLYLDLPSGPRSYDLRTELTLIEPAHRPVKLRLVDKATGNPVAARVHLHGAYGEYLPPRSHHREVNWHWYQDTAAEFANGLNQYTYVDGDCMVELPIGAVYVEVTRGYEVTPLRKRVEIGPDSSELTVELERVLDWRKTGWVSADTHVHFLSPQTALLEGAAEDLNVVNLLASQWGELFTNVGDFDGKTTLVRDKGDGEFLLRVGTENRMQVLGHISLLGYSGSMIEPLCSGGPSESAIGDALDITMADWAQRCLDQKGLVVLPHAPDPQCERAADIVLGLIDAIEMKTFNPFDHQVNPYGLADWYRFLNLGYRLPVVGGSDKMDAKSLLGGIRTYTHLGDRPFSYEAWMRSIRAGNTFVTVGPLLELHVEGRVPGQQIEMKASGGHLQIEYRVESVSLPLDAVEVVVSGLTRERHTCEKTLQARGSARIAVGESCWIALRVRGSYRGRHGEVAAHSSAVFVTVGERPIFQEKDALIVLNQIEGAIAYVDTLAPRPEADRYKKLRATLEAAHRRFHQRMHQQGIHHHHHRHDPGRPHEH
jgi:hypothetical protein